MHYNYIFAVVLSCYHDKAAYFAPAISCSAGALFYGCALEGAVF